MDTKKVFEETGKIGHEIVRIHYLLDELNQEYLKMMEICPHEIVFKYCDDFPRKMNFDGYYFCPACGKTIKCFDKSQVKESSFKTSKIIPLTNLSIIGSKEVYKLIRNEIYNNMDFYYNPDVSIEEIRIKMEDILNDKQSKFNNYAKIFKKN